MRETRFFKQADLLVQVMPFVNAEACFALKGGTAINFFVRDFPRLSVDIDLVYLAVEERATTLKGIDAALQRIAAKIRRAMPSVQVREHRTVSDKLLVKLTVRAADGVRPTLLPVGPFSLSGEPEGAVALDGLLVVGEPVLAWTPLPGGPSLGALSIRHCTLVPGLRLGPDRTPALPGAPSLLVLTVLAGLYVVYYGWYEYRLRTPGNEDDPVVGKALDIQTRLQRLMPNVGNYGWYVVGALLLLGAAVVWSRSTSDVRHDPSSKAPDVERVQ
jgi:hypothetical protein